MYSLKNVVERLGNAKHEYGAVRFLRSSIRYPHGFGAKHLSLLPLAKGIPVFVEFPLREQSRVNDPKMLAEVG